MPRSDLPGISAFFAGFHDAGRNWGAWYWQGARKFGWDNGDAGRNAIFVNMNGPGGWQNALIATTDMQGMVAMAEEAQQHYLAPTPHATPQQLTHFRQR